LKFLVSKITKQLSELDSYVWDVSMNHLREPDKGDKEIYLFYGTRMLYYKICAFFEYKQLPEYLDLFRSKFNSIIDDETKVTKTEGPRYEESDPCMTILEDFREFLSKCFTV